MARREYLFSEPVKTLVPSLLKKFNTFGHYINSSNLDRLWSRAYAMYYGNSQDSSYSLGRTGEQGEYSTITVNHARNLIKHIKAMVTQNRMNFDTIAENSDLSTRNTTIVGNAVLDQLFYEKRYEDKLVQLLELGLIMGTSFALVEWDPGSKLVDADAEGNPIWAGETNFKILSPMETMVEPFKYDYDTQNWVVTRELMNKFDVAAKHAADDPELYDSIIELPPVPEIQYFTKYYEKDEHTIYVYKMYHKPTPHMPRGRMLVFCDKDIVLIDDSNPYDCLPVFCFRPDIRYAGAYGHSPLFDLMPLQEALNVLDSAALTIADNFSMPNIIVSKIANLEASELSGGLRVLEIDYDPDAPNGGMPTPMKMPEISNDMTNLRAQYVMDQEKLSGINQVMRGTEAQTPMSGTAIALSASMSQTYNSSIEREYINIAEKLAFFLLQLIHKFQSYEEILTDTGIANEFAVRSFLGQDLEGIRRVRIHLGNQLAKTLAGRLTIADNLLQQSQITPEEYLEIIRSGSLNKQLETKTAEPGYIQLENEQLAKGKKPVMNALDNHAKHIEAHKSLLFRPEVRETEAVLALILEHITEHTEQMIEMSVSNPTMLSIAMGMPITLPTPHPSTGINPTPEDMGANAGMPGGEGIENRPEASQDAVAAAEGGGVESAASSGESRADKLMQQAEASGQLGQR